MQIDPRNRTSSTPLASPSASSRPLHARVTAVRTGEGLLTLQVGERLIDIPFQSGYKEGERVLFLPLPDGKVSLQEELRTTEWGKLLEYAERRLGHTDPGERELRQILRTILPQLADSLLTRNEAELLLAPLVKQLADTPTPAAQDLAPRIQSALQKEFPGIPPEAPMAQRIQAALGSLANNDFPAAEPLLREIARSPARTLGETPNLSRLIQPLQELDSWGIPPELSTTVIHDARAKVEQALAIPLSKAQTNQLPQELQPFFLAKVTDIQEQTLELELVATSKDSGKLHLRLPLPEKHPWHTLLQANSTIAVQVVSLPTQQALLPLPDAAYLPPTEIPDYVQLGAPIGANLVDAREFVSQYVAGSPNPEIVSRFAQALHSLDLQLPHGESLQNPQKELTLRWLLTPGKSSPPLPSLLHYRSEGNREGELFDTLPPPQREWLRSELEKSGPRLLQPKDLLEILSRMPPAPDTGKDPVASQLQSQLQWTQKDQETRHPDDRQQVFYFLHEGQLLKGQIQIRHEESRKPRKASEESPLRFHVETRTPRLGQVRVDFLVQKGEVKLEFADAVGKAESAVYEERQGLALELEELGLHLSSLAYQSFVGKPAQPIHQAAPRSGFLDLRI